MTETVILAAPAALSAGTAASRARRHKHGSHRNRAATWIATAETRLRQIEAQGHARARALGLASDADIVARAQNLARESGGALSVIEAVDRARTEAGLPQRASKGAVRAAESSDADIVARARRLMAASGGQLSAPVAVDKARAEAAAGRAAGLASTFDVIKTESGKLDANITAAMEAQLLDYTREAIAKARRKLEDGLPLDAGESALDAREALVAVEHLRNGDPDYAKRLLHERVAPPSA